MISHTILFGVLSSFLHNGRLKLEKSTNVLKEMERTRNERNNERSNINHSIIVIKALIKSNAQFYSHRFGLFVRYFFKTNIGSFATLCLIQCLHLDYELSNMNLNYFLINIEIYLQSFLDYSTTDEFRKSVD